MSKLIKRYKRLKTVRKHFKDKNVTVFEVITHGRWRIGDDISPNIIQDKWYDIFDDKLTSYPFSLAKHQNAMIINPNS